MDLATTLLGTVCRKVDASAGFLSEIEYRLKDMVKNCLDAPRVRDIILARANKSPR